jgi:tetratricopeptide (TPR) repeat protein
MPGSPEPLASQSIAAGFAHQQAGRLDAAERVYREILDTQPDNADALHLLGLVLHQRGDNAAAISCLDAAVRLQPANAELSNNRGTVLQALGKFEAAAASHARAAELNPEFAEAFNNLGNALCALTRFREAQASYEKALAIKPGFAEAWRGLGDAQCGQQRYADALAGYDQALALHPRSAEIHNNKGNALHQLRRYAEALPSYDAALDVNPAYVEALSNRAPTLVQLDRYEEALASCERALAINSAHVKALNNRGLVLHELGRYADAVNCFDAALAVDPAHASARYNRGLCRLALGDFEQGWLDHESRWQCDAFTAPRRNFDQPLWLGEEDIHSKTILLHAEQGFGDTIQFARYAQAVTERGAQVVLEVQPALVSLLSGLPGADQVLGKGEALPAFDLHCPLLSLPLALKTRLQNIPAPIPYLRAGDAALAKWAVHLGPRSRLRVGVACSGSPTHQNDRNRSIALHKLAKLIRPGAQLVFLQNDIRSGDREFLESANDVLCFASELGDFSDSAALVSQMDLVISVDTSIAHLAGALGKPVWILLPYAMDWRWLRGREDSPWYPTARLFRQSTPGNWDGVLARVAVALGDFEAG